MSVKPADLVAIQFTTQSPTTGALTSADSLPTGVLVQNGADTAEVVTVALVSTGVYSASVTIPVGYVAGDEVQIRVAATVATVAGAAVVWSAVLDGLRVADLDLTDLPTIASDVAGPDGAAMRGTDNAYTGTPPTVEGIASQVRVELAAELALVDAAVTSREATGAAAGAVAGLAVEANVEGHVTTALTAYDPPTNAELTAGLDALPTAAEIVTAILTASLAGYEATGKTGTRLGDMLAIIRAATAGRLAISGTTLTVYEVDGTTVAGTYTLAADYSTRSTPA